MATKAPKKSPSKKSVKIPAVPPVMPATIEDVPLPQGSRILENTVCLNLTCHGISTRRRVGKDSISTDADKTMLHVSKDIIDSGTYRELKAADQQMYRWIRRRSLPSHFRKGVYLVPLKLVLEIDERIEEFLKERQGFIEAFLAEYPEKVADARTRLKKLFRTGDYPTVDSLRYAFRVTSGYIALSVPGSLQGISRELYTRTKERAEAQWAEAGQEIRDALRVSMARLVKKMVARLSETEGGSKKRIVEAGIERAEEFLSLFDARNLTDDTRLADLVNQARQLLRGVDVEQLRENDDVRETVKKGFEEIERTMGAMVVNAPSRKIKFQDDEEEDD